MEIQSISTFGVFQRSIQCPTVEFEDFEENNIILLRKVNFALMIPNPSLDCSYVVLNFWANLSLDVLIKLFLQKKPVTRSLGFVFPCYLLKCFDLFITFIPWKPFMFFSC